MQKKGTFKTMAGLTENKAYRKFVNQRDQALEEILLNHQRKLTDLTNGVLTDALQIISNEYDRLIAYPGYCNAIDAVLNQKFYGFLMQIKSMYAELRTSTYFLTVQSELEAIKRAVGVEAPQKSLKHMALEHIKREHGNAGQLDQRLEYSLGKFKNKIMDAVKLGCMKKDPKDVFLQRVFNQFPQYQPITKRKPLKRLKEASQDNPVDMTLFDLDLWDKAISDYEKTYVPEFRSPETVFSVKRSGGHTGADPNFVYGWEIERDMTHDFVVSVRQGVVDAANINGITDFIVVAILDDRTCDHCCGDVGCVDFDGMTTSEIEKMTGGAQSAPPFHFNCRCTLAPFTKDMPEVEQSNEGDFDEWLNS